MNCIESHNHNHGSYNEQKYMEALDKSVIDLLEHISIITPTTT